MTIPQPPTLPPYASPAPPSSPRGGNIVSWIALLAGIGALVVGMIALVRPTGGEQSAGPATTVQAPPAQPTPSAQERQQAAEETCTAVENFRLGFRGARDRFVAQVDGRRDWDSPESLAVQANYYGVAATQLAYLSEHTNLDAPAAILDAIGDLREAITAMLDADARREPASVSNVSLREADAAQNRIDAACEEAGAR